MIAGDSDIPHSGWSGETDAGSKNRTTTSSNDRGGWKPYAPSDYNWWIGTELEVLATETIAEKVFNLLDDMERLEKLIKKPFIGKI
jgi:hypothetical protein